ncbi:MAG: DUF4215 domain-containing protein, partial [Myxococcota bacterium]
EGGFAARLPPLPDGQVMVYRSVVNYSIGAERVVPANLGEPWLEHWFGPVEPIYCTSFDDGVAEGWQLNGTWEVGPPQGQGGDPSAAAGDDPFVLGLDVSSDGLYPAWSSESVVSPTITIPSGYESVRLHYQRWLTVEDGFYDQATILADGQPAWSNFASTNDFEATTHHRDAQWAFHDVDLSPWASDGQVTLAFEVNSDGGLEMGGWTIDELCVVGYGTINTLPGCGDGVLGEGEQCDDGNQVAGDGCSAQCQNEGPGQEEEPDEDEPDEDEPGLDDDDLDDGGLVSRGCDCHARAPQQQRSGALGLLTLLLLGWRRRDR